MIDFVVRVKGATMSFVYFASQMGEWHKVADMMFIIIYAHVTGTSDGNSLCFSAIG